MRKRYLQIVFLVSVVFFIPLIGTNCHEADLPKWGQLCNLGAFMNMLGRDHLEPAEFDFLVEFLGLQEAFGKRDEGEEVEFEQQPESRQRIVAEKTDKTQVSYLVTERSGTPPDYSYDLTRYQKNQQGVLSKVSTLEQGATSVPESNRGYDPTVSMGQDWLSYLSFFFPSSYIVNYSNPSLNYSVHKTNPDGSVKMQQPQFQKTSYNAEYLQHSSPRDETPEWYGIVEYGISSREAKFGYIDMRDLESYADPRPGYDGVLVPVFFTTSTLAEWKESPSLLARIVYDDLNLRFRIYDLSPRVTTENPEIAFLGTANGIGPNVLWYQRDGVEEAEQILIPEGVVECYYPKFDREGKRLAFIGRNSGNQFAIFLVDNVRESLQAHRIGDWYDGLGRTDYPTWPALQELLWPVENRSVVFVQYSTPTDFGTEGKTDQDYKDAWAYDVQLIEIFINANGSVSGIYELFDKDPPSLVDIWNFPVSLTTRY